MNGTAVVIYRVVNPIIQDRIQAFCANPKSRHQVEFHSYIDGVEHFIWTYPPGPNGGTSKANVEGDFYRMVSSACTNFPNSTVTNGRAWDFNPHNIGRMLTQIEHSSWIPEAPPSVIVPMHITLNTDTGIVEGRTI